MGVPQETPKTVLQLLLTGSGQTPSDCGGEVPLVFRAPRGRWRVHVGSPRRGDTDVSKVLRTRHAGTRGFSSCTRKAKTIIEEVPLDKTKVQPVIGAHGVE